MESINLLEDVADLRPPIKHASVTRLPVFDEFGAKLRRATVRRVEPQQERIILRRLLDAGDWVSHGEIKAALFGHREKGGPDCAGDNVRRLIYRVRKRLRPGFRIENRSGFGYRLVVDEEALQWALINQIAEMSSDTAADQAA